MASRKRKRGSTEKDDTEVIAELCVIHRSDSSSQHFTRLTEERLSKLKDIRKLRNAQPVGSSDRMPDVCAQIPEAVEENHGYHRDCYKTFTANLHRLSTGTVVAETSVARPPRCPSNKSEKFIFNDDCIFCRKAGRKSINKGGTRTTEATSKFEFGGGDTILQVAERKKDFDLLRRIKGYDLFASEAQYHRSCRVAYIKDPTSWRSSDPKAASHQHLMEEAHNRTFAIICSIIDENIIHKYAVMKLDYLRELYVQHLEDTQFSNPNYRSEKLKTKLVKHYGNLLSFVAIQTEPGRFGSFLVFNSKTDVGEAVKQAYLLGIRDKTKDVALNLRNTVREASQDSEPLQWPPTARYLENLETIIPEELEKFLMFFITGKQAIQASTKSNRLVQSIGQDLCRAATNGRWKLPKHILICMTLRHLFRSAELINIMNRFGHSENYSFSLELETALASALHEASELLPIQIIRNPTSPSLFHSDFDNFDQNTASGSVHTSHGIMLQEVGPLTETTAARDPQDTRSQDAQCPAISTVSISERSKERSVTLETSESLPECYVSQRQSPGYKVRQWTCVDGETIRNAAQYKDLLWILARLHSATTAKGFPGWAGFVSSTGEKPLRTTTIDYYPVINCPITEYKAVQECLRISEEATKQVGQKYTITSFDLGVCMKAYPLVWKNPVRYKDHIIMIGSFHTVCAFFKMIGKKMASSGLSDILVEAGLITSGSVHGVESGKLYNRAVTCHKTLLEALERLLLQVFLSTREDDQHMSNLSAESQAVYNSLLDSPSKSTLNSAMADIDIHDYIRDYSIFRSEVAEGKLGKTAQFWLSYMDHIWLVLDLLRAVKTNNLPLYTQCLYKMADLFFSFDGQNYSRYLTFFSVFLANVESTHPGATKLLEGGAISVARSLVQGNRCAVDKTIEETFMKHAKSHGGSGGCGAGLTGIVTNFNTYQRWVKTTHERAQYVDVTLAKADMLSDSEGGGQHKDLRPAEIRKSEKQVAKVMEAVNSFLNPFTVSDGNKLYCISSGAPASAEVEKDMMSAEKAGKQAKEEFISERLETNSKFFEPVKKMKLKTFQTSNKTVKLKTVQNKIVTYKQHSSLAIQLLVKSQPHQKISIETLMSYPLSSVPCSLGTADGYMAKTDKSKGVQFLVKDVDDAHTSADARTMIIQDGNALFHTMMDIPENFQQICHRIFDMMPKNFDFVFSTDMYQPGSIKEMERELRGSSEKLIISGQKTKKPANWRNFLMNGENKSQLVNVMYEVWSSDEFAPKLSGRKAVIVVQGHCYLLQEEDCTTVKTTELPMMFSNQEETDTRIVLYIAYAQEQGYETVRIRSPDSDVFFIALHHAANFEITVLFDTGSGNKKRLINITELAKKFGQSYSTALMCLHAFTHCDTASAFKGIGKVRPIKLLQRCPRYIEVLCRLGDTWNLSNNLVNDLEEFTCAMYGKDRYTSVDALRYAALREKCGGVDGTIKLDRNIDLGQFPPCKKALYQHIKRVNYQTGIWKAANIPQPTVPKATDGHGWKICDGKIEPIWFDGPVVPTDIAEEDDALESDNEIGSSGDEAEQSDGISEDNDASSDSDDE